MNDTVEERPASVGTRLVLPCGHRWTVPLGLPPEVVAAELLHHHTVCELDSGAAFFGPFGSPAAWLIPGEVGP